MIVVLCMIIVVLYVVIVVFFCGWGGKNDCVWVSGVLFVCVECVV